MHHLLLNLFVQTSSSLAGLQPEKHGANRTELPSLIVRGGNLPNGVRLVHAMLVSGPTSEQLGVCGVMPAHPSYSSSKRHAADFLLDISYAGGIMPLGRSRCVREPAIGDSFIQLYSFLGSGHAAT